MLRIWSFTNILACVERSLPWLSQQPAHIVVPLSQGGQLIVQTDGYVAGWGAFARGLEGFVPKLWEDRMQNSQYDVNLRSSIDNAQVRDVLAYCFMVGTGCGCGGAWSRTRSEREGGGLGGRTPVRRGPGTPGDPGGRGPGAGTARTLSFFFFARNKSRRASVMRVFCDLVMLAAAPIVNVYIAEMYIPDCRNQAQRPPPLIRFSAETGDDDDQDQIVDDDGNETKKRTKASTVDAAAAWHALQIVKDTHLKNINAVIQAKPHGPRPT